MRNFYKKAFTLSEVLLALALVGIIAAMVIPGTMHYANKKMLTSQLKNTVVGLQDLAQEQLAESKTKVMSDTDFAKSSILLSSAYFDVLKNCNASDPCFAASYKTIANSSSITKTKNNVNLKNGGIQLKSGIAIRYDSNYETEDGNLSVETYKFSATNTKELYFGTFYIDVNGLDKPNVLGRDFFVIPITDKGRLGNNVANENSKDDLKTACTSASDQTACSAYLELNDWNMDY